MSTQVVGKRAYITAREISDLFDVSIGYAYKVIRELNNELKKQGYMVIQGKVPARFLEEKWYGLKDSHREEGDNK